MNFDDYVKHISQKYKVAIAMAVMKQKPENVTIEHYITDLQNKINESTESNDLDITIDSDDFNFNDTGEINDDLNSSTTILKDFDVNMECIGEHCADDGDNHLNDTNEDFYEPCTNQLQNSISNPESYTIDALKSKKIATTSKAINILRNIRKEPVKETYTPFGNAKSYEDSNFNSIKSKDTKNTYNKENDPNNMDIGFEKINEINFNTQNESFTDDLTNTNNVGAKEIETESLPASRVNNLAAKVYKNIRKDPVQMIDLNTKNEHQHVVENKQVTELNVNAKNKRKTTKEDPKTMEAKKGIDITEKVRKYLAKQTQDILEKAKQDKNTAISIREPHLDVQKDINNDISDTELAQTVPMLRKSQFLNTSDLSERSRQPSFTGINDISKNNDLNLKQITQLDTPATFSHECQDTSQNFTHISQSQTHNIEVANKFIYGRKDNFLNNVMPKTNDTIYNSDPNKDAIEKAGIETNGNVQKQYTDSDHNTKFTSNTLSFENNNFQNIDTFGMDFEIKNNSNTNPNNDNIAQNSEVTAIEQNYENVTANESQIFDVQTQIEYVIDKQGNAYKILNGNFQNNSTITLTKETNIQKVFDNINNTQTAGTSQEKRIDFDDIDILSSDEEDLGTQREIVPFKVIEELNKVKMFLNRKVERNTDGYLTDSGYTSDSQSRSSFKSALQNSNGWVNESAFCLFKYVSECPLNEATSDITSEISQVLGKLIDKLHDIENYPSFLDEILEYVDKLIQDIHTGDHSLLTNDEYTQRVLLLNKSIHIIQYSIDKINVKLEDLHKKLTTNTTYELENIPELENVCHIIHLLEYLIKRYMKSRNNCNDTATQSQTSQEEKLFKRSCITDIWKKKWNPEYKKLEKSHGGLEKKCVAAKCSEVLNKIVVGCMEGYSLVAFAALQCFNLLQS